MRGLGSVVPVRSSMLGGGAGSGGTCAAGAAVGVAFLFGVAVLFRSGNKAPGDGPFQTLRNAVNRCINQALFDSHPQPTDFAERQRILAKLREQIGCDDQSVPILCVRNPVESG